MADILLIAVVLIWVPLIPLRFFLHAITHLWRKLADLTYVVAVIYWAVIDAFLISSMTSWRSVRFSSFPGALTLGMLLIVGGILLAYRSITTLGIPVFLIRPQVSPKKAQARLVVTGPYRWIRHPFYFSEWLFLLGVALFSNSWIVLGILIVTLLFDPVITLLEEKELVARFGTVYREYQKKVPRLLPTFKS